MTASADMMMEHVASYLKKDPIEVKLANMYKLGQKDINQIPISFDFREIYRSEFVGFLVGKCTSSQRYSSFTPPLYDLKWDSHRNQLI